jgi:GPH family glycoside/pentoside/hexuronide:cation symporter
MANPKLRLSTKLGFGVCDLGGNLFFTALGFWSLNYLTDTVGLGAGLAGVAVMIGKLWDAVTDPMMGYLSDRTRTRWGRRRPYLLFGAVPLLLSMWFFFTSPGIDPANQIALTVWATVALMMLNTAYTVINIPYSSLTPELTDDYHERTSLNGYRFGFAVFGTIRAPPRFCHRRRASDPGGGFSAVGLILGTVMAVTALATFLSVREKDHSNTEIPKEGFFATYLAVFRNKPYLLVLGTYALNLTALNFLQGILVYYTKYIYGNESITTPAMVILLLVAMVCIPVSVFLSKKVGKKLTYQISFGVLASACALIYLFGEALGERFFLAMMVYAGIGIGFGYVAPWAMVPDTIEYDAVMTGKRKEGSFYGMWTFASKVGQSLSMLISGAVLSAGGYVVDAAQTHAAKGAIKLLIGPMPVVVLVAAIVLIQFYPLDEQTYERLIAEERAREAH